MDAKLHTVLQKFQHLKIQLKEITSATNDFDNQNYIGGGGFGNVYKGEVSHCKGRSMGAIKRLDSSNGQGIPEFLKELTRLPSFSHENIISLLGYCCEGREMILVYELASLGSLDHHLSSRDLTWRQRLKICIDVAKGLNYLHDPRKTHQRLIHCDVKSANVLLDNKWNAKVADFGLSIMGSANEENSTVITFAAGTPGYVDPQYEMTHTLTKKSDVYSFGVVMFEVLCGKLCCTYSNGRLQHNLLPTWIKSYEHKKLDDIIFKDPTTLPLDPSALKIFSDVVYRCLKESREDRPEMAEVVTDLKTALSMQEFIEQKALLIFYEEISKSAFPPLYYKSHVELKNILSKGVLLYGGSTWFSFNKEDEHCELISIAKCLGSKFSNLFRVYYSRFPEGTYYSDNGIFKTRVKGRFLSPRITYTVNLVFKFRNPNRVNRCEPIFLKYKLKGETKSSVSCLAYMREDGWWMCELYQFITDLRTVKFRILFDGFYFPTSIDVEGIEFRPLEEVDEKQPTSVSDSDANWEERLPTDYKDIMKWTTVQWNMKKEAYSFIRKGFFINNNYNNTRIWFSLDKNGKKCHMLSAAHIWGPHKKMMSLPESRFGAAFMCDSLYIQIDTEIYYQLVSSETKYASYLVYKLPNVHSRFETPVRVADDKQHKIWYIYLVCPKTPVIRTKAYQNTHNPLNKPKMQRHPQQRNDGWMEVQLCLFKTRTAINMSPMSLCLKNSCNKTLEGLIIEGVEFRPL